MPWSKIGLLACEMYLEDKISYTWQYECYQEIILVDSSVLDDVWQFNDNDNSMTNQIISKDPIVFSMNVHQISWFSTVVDYKEGSFVCSKGLWLQPYL